MVDFVLAQVFVIIVFWGYYLVDKGKIDRVVPCLAREISGAEQFLFMSDIRLVSIISVHRPESPQILAIFLGDEILFEIILGLPRMFSQLIGEGSERDHFPWVLVLRIEGIFHKFYFFV